MPIAAGRLDQRVTLQRPDNTVDALGQRTEGWTDVATVWANVEPLRGRELFEAGQMQSEINLRVTIRYRSDVTADMRVVWRGVPHAIVAEPIDVSAAKVRLELMCAGGGRDTQ